ncbi:MAG: hypothetical protein IK008_01640 [Bacteroidales bacterium]|nr:hypothetical protein [Bacteroidales bacterium]
MKKSLFVLITAIAAVLSCTKETPDGNEPLQKLVFTGVTDPTKTVLESDFTIKWSTDDDITVFPGENASGVTFDVTATSGNGHTATFEGSAAASAGYYALSPAQVGVSISGGKISAVLPTTQTPVAGSFGPESNVAVAVASDYVFQFKNVGALVGFTIGQDDITGIKLEALNGEVLSGTAVVNPADGSLVSKSGVSYVQMNGSLAKNATYYFVVLPGTYSGGFRITLFKGAQYARTSLTASYDIPRNGNLSLGTLALNNWKTAFVEGEDVFIKGSAEDGQKLAYVGADDYWDGDIQYSDVANYAYNYEIFTRLTQDQKFYFKTAGGENYTLNAAGTAVEPLAKIANAPYGAPSDGIYRIRMDFPSGAAEVKKITEVKYDIYGLDSRALTYVGEGVWSSSNFLMRTSSYMNRYRFLVKFADDSKQYYGRMVSNNGNPIYGQTEATYFHVQPTIDSNADHWSPCFQYPSVCQDVDNRYYCTMTLSLNNDNGHYTHSITNMTDSQIGEGVVFICRSNEAGQQMVYIASNHYNSSMADYGDNSTLVPTAISDYFEIFTRINSGEVFYFYNATTGKYYAPTSTGAGVQEISNPSEATYSISTGGAWRIRANFSTGAANIRRIDQVRTELNYDGGFADGVHVLSYTGKGTWAKNSAAIKGHEGQYGRHPFTEYIIKIWFNRDNADNEINCWQVYGTTSVKSGSPDPADDGSYWNLQPATGDNWSHVFFYPSWTIDTSGSRQYYATISVYMNDKFGNYTHRFSNVVYEDNIPE